MEERPRRNARQCTRTNLCDADVEKKLKTTNRSVADDIGFFSFDMETRRKWSEEKKFGKSYTRARKNYEHLATVAMLGPPYFTSSRPSDSMWRRMPSQDPSLTKSYLAATALRARRFPSARSLRRPRALPFQLITCSFLREPASIWPFPMHIRVKGYGTVCGQKNNG